MMNFQMRETPASSVPNGTHRAPGGRRRTGGRDPAGQPGRGLS